MSAPTAEEKLYTSVRPYVSSVVCITHKYILNGFTYIMFLHTMYQDTQHWKTLNTVSMGHWSLSVCVGGGGHWPMGDRSAGLPGEHLSPGEDLDP